MFTLPILALLLSAAPPIDAEARAVAFLAREVPRWHRENNCYSCHHNGDAARALYLSRAAGLRVPEVALADTTRWLGRPAGWDKNGGDGPFSDKKLARLQFAATLAVADVHDADSRRLAARYVAGSQDKDGSWRVTADGRPGPPATLSTALATHLASSTLTRLEPERHKGAIAMAAKWQRETPLDTVLDAAGVLLGLRRSDDEAAVAQRDRALALIRKGEARDGGWGPFVNSSPEVFDTAVVLAALAAQQQTPEVRQWIRRGRAYLLATQESDGGWPETTRPSGGDSETQRLSTSGWAALALIETRRLPGEPRTK
ncbi:MAG: prenyltransferase/squalene oxidase repeat-containing protein [Gemmataceae bacterium]